MVEENVERQDDVLPAKDACKSLEKDHISLSLSVPRCEYAGSVVSGYLTCSFVMRIPVQSIEA